MDARTVLIFVVLVLLKVGFGEGRPAPSTGDVSQHIGDVSQHNCSCGDETIVCGGADSWVPWLSCGLSFLLFFVPCMRIYKTRGLQGIDHTFFWWSLILGCWNYNVWIRYSMECHLGHPTFPIFVTSIGGCLINAFLSGCAASMITNIKVKSWRIYVTAGGTILVWIVIFNPTPVSVIGWLGLVLGALHHMFRMKATAYDKFNCILAIASLAGCANGFIWLKHPNLCVAMQYKIASYIIGVLRGWEAFLWFSPWVGKALWRAEGGEGEKEVEDPRDV